MMKKTLAFVSIMALSGAATAACPAGKLNGLWHGTLMNSQAGIGVCAYKIQGNKLHPTSYCTNQYGDEVRLTHGKVRKNLNACSVELSYRFDGEPHMAALSMDRQVTVGNGIFFAEWSGNNGIVSLVKK